MSAVIEALARHAVARPRAIAATDGAVELDYGTLHRLVQECAAQLEAREVRTIGLLADNGVAWLVADLAAIASGRCVVPIPTFFSPAQQVHVMRSAGADALLVDPRTVAIDASSARDPRFPPIVAGAVSLELFVTRRPADAAVLLPPGTRKITFTSGTTGQPKGVCLGLAEMERVAEGLCTAGGARRDDVHLGVLPLSLLLENIGGVYAPILAGATTVLPPMANVGLVGASGLDPLRLVRAFATSGATNAILVPQMLMALSATLDSQHARLEHLRFLAVGGARVGGALLDRAAAVGLPVYEGYGLSECASVVSLNRVGAARRGSVGQPLRHLRVSIAADGEVIVTGNGFRGYVGELPRDASEPVATGDIGAFDEEGFLYLSGRKKNVFITAYGRNVSPEWIESELCAHPAIAQAAVFGEARPWNAAVVTPRADDATVDAAIRSVNRGLPDYARVKRWIKAGAPFSTANGQLTTNGRIRRSTIEAEYQNQLHMLYENELA